MPKRSSNRREPDENETAFRVVRKATRDKAEHDKNPAAVALGRLGGMKGGPARAAKLSARERTLIARKAAVARWKEK